MGRYLALVDSKLTSVSCRELMRWIYKFEVLIFVYSTLTLPKVDLGSLVGGVLLHGEKKGFTKSCILVGTALGRDISNNHQRL